MATWRIAENLAVTYEAGGTHHECGKAKESSLAEVEGWAVCEARPWDIVTSPSGTFVRQKNPSTWA